MSSITVEGQDVDEIANALDLSTEEEAEEAEDSPWPDEATEKMETVHERLDRTLEGLRRVTQNKPEGRQRKVVQRKAGLIDMEDWRFGKHLRVLEEAGLAEQDGNRWRYALED
jgi:predicted FMN-binding regulatory protein PaiB